MEDGQRFHSIFSLQSNVCVGGEGGGRGGSSHAPPYGCFRSMGEIVRWVGSVFRSSRSLHGYSETYVLLEATSTVHKCIGNTSTSALYSSGKSLFGVKRVLPRLILKIKRNTHFSLSQPCEATSLMLS